MTSDQLPQLLSENTQTPMGRLLLNLLNDSRRRCVQYGHTKIRGTHAGLLAHITPSPINLKMLTDQTVISQQAVGKIARELARMGYVDININPSNRREMLIALSPKGESLKEDLQKINEEVRDDYRSLLGNTALANFEEQLSHTWQIIQSSDIDDCSVKSDRDFLQSL